MTHREEDKRVRRGKDAAKGTTVIFWRLGGGDEEELLALRVLRLDLVAIFFEEAEIVGGLCRWPGPRIRLGWKWTTMVDESMLNLTVILHGTTQTRCIVVPKATANASQPSTMAFVISAVSSRLFDTKVVQNPKPDSPHPAHSERKQRPDFSIRLHVVIVCYARKYNVQ